MSDFSTFLKNELLDHAFRNSAYTPAATMYVALYTTAPTAAGGGTEVTGGNYARKTVTFSAASSGAITSSGAVTWTASAGDYGTVVAIGIMDALTSGNLLSFKAITSAIVNSGNVLNFPAGDIDIT